MSGKKRGVGANIIASIRDRDDCDSRNPGSGAKTVPLVSVPDVPSYQVVKLLCSDQNRSETEEADILWSKDKRDKRTGQADEVQGSNAQILASCHLTNLYLGISQEAHKDQQIVNVRRNEGDNAEAEKRRDLLH